ILEAKKQKLRIFDVDASVKDQVYQGSLKEDFHSSQAVKKTRGMILTVGSDNAPLPLQAFYHSTCGGQTELPEHVWSRPLYPGFHRQITCPFCRESPAYSWKIG